MNKILIIGGLILVAVTVVILPRTIAEYKTFRSAHVAEVKVLKLPNCEVGYKNKFMTVLFEEKSYILRTKCKYTKNLIVGQNLPMFHTQGSNIFLFSNENPVFELCSNLMLGAIGVSIITLGFIKHKTFSRN